ncbi:tetracenomycin polyketide synthesis O-methyltransferase TcmP [Colletotrichum tofieldiae]|uniref:Tetracenomycin polyketide synthesis O-methyltransferase TcmP n=1 Tax=Colletotrichum tofieldiae TaxID=708197 RepID=A0A166Y4I6_9PEZI|nr:tetracenomycin polyketide synthesis O-methyltransferase TcmP [Colletotrichum tofieldiae]GKT53966.1 tetracenomycin polyketide synthesis O-methyltransferase TcmP [Colletotrichum tofieldiae]GKT73701.1 tetracenomycin polyketide synthesis O-methyltransferase TcmP [Colletotrichum tofieldiae]GKT95654.1 tetracenomycin polyketide synthesis O-methyltransferase TcmP [Colletotrichum tofieldiae]
MPPSASTNGLGKGKVTLNGAEETLLLTLLARAQDAESSHPVLNDQYAVELVAQIKDQGYDFKRTMAGSSPSYFLANAVAMRARMLDIFTEKFLRRHPGPATVLHLACGLDSRSLRVRWQGEGRLWVDADRKEAIELRRKLVKEPEPGKGEYRLMQPNIHEDTWLSDCKIPTDRPVLILFEGLTPYLTHDEIYGLLRRIVNYFSQRGVHGEIRFDAVGSFVYYAVNYWYNTTFKLMGTRFYYYLDDPKTLEQKVPGLKFTERMFGMPDLLTYGFFGWVLAFFGWLTDLFGITSRIGGGYGYKF